MSLSRKKVKVVSQEEDPVHLFLNSNNARSGFDENSPFKSSSTTQLNPKASLLDDSISLPDNGKLPDDFVGASSTESFLKSLGLDIKRPFETESETNPNKKSKKSSKKPQRRTKKSEKKELKIVYEAPEIDLPVAHTSLSSSLQYASLESESLIKTQSEEEILSPATNRFTLLPIKHRDIWRAYEIAYRNFWTWDEIDLDTDLSHWNNKLNDEEREYLTLVLAFFNSSDGIVNENLALTFMQEVQNMEARMFYGIQIEQEVIHIHSYSFLIEALIKDPVKLQLVLSSITSIKIIKDKADWALKWMDKTYASFAERLVAFACVEGIFFTASFASIFYLKKKGLMPGLANANILISRDENSHCEFAALLFSKLKHKPSNGVIISIIKSAVYLEKEFVKGAVKKPICGLNADLLCQWVEYTADLVAKLFGIKTPIFATQNPFPWMNSISMPLKSNFHETRVPEYAHITSSQFSFNAPF